MSALDVPEAGLSLCRHAPGTDATTRPTNVMRLNLAQNTVDELIQSLRENKSARIRFGKHQTLYYGSKSQHFHSAPEAHRSEIYTCGSTSDKESAYFAGVLSHRLEVQKAREATAATDQALANLELSLNAYEQGKESKKTHMIDDINQVKSLRGKPSGLLRTPASKVEREKDRLLKTSSANRSLSTSPGLGVSHSPASIPGLTPTSAPATQNKDRIRLDALKVPFIHLLAVRAVSAKFLARVTRASLDDCTALTQKYGVENRLNRDKFDLKDKAYKDLDVWNFPYPSQEDRQEAIENAISAFDRMRISRTDKQWQMLLPKEERGKGKCLSRLNLSTGPIKKPATSRVQAQNADDKDGDTTGHETDRASTSGAKTATTQKKRTGEKDSAAAKKAPAKGKITTNSTLTGRVTKKAERKPAAKPDAKVKSAEYVHESDEDEDTEMPDVPATTDKTREKTDTTQKPQPKPVAKRDVSHAPEIKHPAPSKVDKSERPPPKPDTTTSSHQPPAKPTTALKKPPSSRTSNSPRKPSPLGSSPPTNASEIRTHSRASSQNHPPSGTSSSSSSPLISQISRPKQQQQQQQPKATATSAPKAAQTNDAVKSTPVTNPLKRKAEPERPSVRQSHTMTNGSLEHKRRRAPSISSGSTGSASPPMSYELLRRQLREKSQRFKQRYAKYRTLYEAMARHPDPPRADLDNLQRQHAALQRTKKEIWDEDRRLREELRR